MTIAVFLPLCAALVILLGRLLNRPVPAWKIGIITLLCASVKMSFMAAKSFFHAKVYSAFLMPFLTWNGMPYAWRLHFDRAELFLSLFITATAFLCLLFARNTISEKKINEFTGCMLALTFSVLFCLGAKNMFQFFVGWDLSALFSYLLLTTNHEKQSIRRSGVRFLIGHKLTDIPLFFIFMTLYSKTGFFFVPPFIGQEMISFSGSEPLLYALCLFGAVSAKLIFFGTHVFYADISEMPIPALGFVLPSALGSLGIYLLYHCLPIVLVYDIINNLMIGVGLVTVATGTLFALTQNNIKLLLCYLAMSQFGYVFTAFGLVGADLGLYTFVALMIPVIGLFLSAESIIFSIGGETDLSHMGGLKKEKPFTFWAMWLFAFCCIGFPSVGTYGARKDLYAAAFCAEGGTFIFIFALLLFCTAAVLSKVLHSIFYAPSKLPIETVIKIKRIMPPMFFSLSVLMLVSLFQDELLEHSILPDLTQGQSMEMFIASLAAFLGIPISFLYFRHKTKRTKPPGFIIRYVYQFCSKGFYFSSVYAFLFIRPCAALAKKLWLFADVGVIDQWGVSRLSQNIQKLAEKLQKRHTGKLYDSLAWGGLGVFVLLLSALFVFAGR